VLFLQVAIYLAYGDLNLRFNKKVYYTVITIKVNHRFSRGNIISVLSSVNSAISDYNEY